MAEGIQFNISYDLNGMDPDEVDKIVRKTMKDLAKSGNFDAGAYEVLPTQTGKCLKQNKTKQNKVVVVQVVQVAPH